MITDPIFWLYAACFFIAGFTLCLWMTAKHFKKRIVDMPITEILSDEVLLTVPVLHAANGPRMNRAGALKIIQNAERFQD